MTAHRAYPGKNAIIAGEDDRVWVEYESGVIKGEGEEGIGEGWDWIW